MIFLFVKINHIRDPERIIKERKQIGQLRIVTHFSKRAPQLLEERGRTGQETSVYPALQQFGRWPRTGQNLRVAPLSIPYHIKTNFS